LVDAALLQPVIKKIAMTIAPIEPKRIFFIKMFLFPTRMAFRFRPRKNAIAGWFVF
jgi:hypothetical protein